MIIKGSGSITQWCMLLCFLWVWQLEYHAMRSQSRDPSSAVATSDVLEWYALLPSNYNIHVLSIDARIWLVLLEPHTSLMRRPLPPWSGRGLGMSSGQGTRLQPHTSNTNAALSVQDTVAVFVWLAESIFISLFFHCLYNVGSVIVYLAGQCRNRILFCHVLCHDVQSTVSTELSLTLLPAETCFYKAHNNRFYIRH